MGERRREDRNAGPTKFQVLATEGVPTFLLLEGAAARNRRPVRPDAEGERLGVLAGEIEDRLPPPELHPWPGGVAVTLGELAVNDFFPRAVAPPNAVVPDRGLYRALADGRYVRAVNFHATPSRLAGRLEEQLSRLAERFAPVSYDDLVGLVATGDWPHERPGVVLNFFDGFRDNFEVAAPILDRLGLIGWFFVVSGWVATPPGEQRSFATRHLIDLPYDDGDLPADGRFALSPDEVGALAERGHVVASHTRTHATASPELVPNPPPAALEQEVAASQRDLERLARLPVRALAWREGTPLGASARADKALANTGYELLFANHAVQGVL
jgi:peptidoglycan/xylan/chitin deacetylase (PgdA/CDA1 family)